MSFPADKELPGRVQAQGGGLAVLLAFGDLGWRVWGFSGFRV